MNGRNNGELFIAPGKDWRADSPPVSRQEANGRSHRRTRVRDRPPLDRPEPRPGVRSRQNGCHGPRLTLLSSCSLVDAIVNTGPREDSTRIGSQGTVRRQAVDVSPLRRVNQAIALITIGVRESAFRSQRTVAECQFQFGRFVSSITPLNLLLTLQAWLMSSSTPPRVAPTRTPSRRRSTSRSARVTRFDD